jgi:MATE family multidrug resistance protein
LLLFQASGDAENFAATYFHIRVWSAPGALANYVIVGWLVGRQDTRRAMVLQIGMNGANIVLDLTFVLGFGWGVAGVAAATAISEYGAAAVGLAIVSRRYVGPIGRGWLLGLFERAELVRLFTINRDLFLRTLCLLFSFAYLASEAGKLGDVPLAANAILIQFLGFLSFGLDGFAHAAEALVGGAMGGKDRGGLRAVVLAAGRWALIFALGYAAVYAVGGWWIVALLTSIPEVQAAARDLLPWAVAMPVVAVWPYLFDGIFIGATFTKEMRNGMAVALAVYLLCVWTFGAAFGLHGLWASMLIFMAARGATLALWYPRIERAME